VFVCGYASEPQALMGLRARTDLAERASEIGGRFSALVVDRRRGRFALATQVARVDSIFRAENERLLVWGNQASVVSALRDGTVRFAPRRLSSLICAGFFGDDQTPYEGVDAVRPLTTILVADQRVQVESVGLTPLKERMARRARRSLTARLWRRSAREDLEGLDALSSSFASAFMPLIGRSDVTIGLTGGMDSRLILAGALAAGIPVNTYTLSRGDGGNRADILVARLVAERAGVPHRVTESSVTAAVGPPRHGLLHVTQRTLAVSDGMLGFQYPCSPAYAHEPSVAMSGHGGEVLRGGYGEKSKQPGRAQVAATFQALWCHSPDLFHDDLVEEHRARATSWIECFPESVPADDLLECLYVDRRCGRWVAGSTRGSTRRITPLLDNRVIRDTLLLPASIKKEHRLHRGLIDRLLPQVSDLPLANKFRYGTSDEAQERIRAQWPDAFAQAEPVQKKKPPRELSPDREATIMRYVFEEGRIALLSDVVRIDRVVEHFAGSPKHTREKDRFLSGLYTACVLLSESWRRRRL
jgi:hypothetical protein